MSFLFVLAFTSLIYGQSVELVNGKTKQWIDGEGVFNNISRFNLITKSNTIHVKEYFIKEASVSSFIDSLKKKGCTGNCNFIQTKGYKATIELNSNTLLGIGTDSNLHYQFVYKITLTSSKMGTSQNILDTIVGSRSDKVDSAFIKHAYEIFPEIQSETGIVRVTLKSKDLLDVRVESSGILQKYYYF